MNQTELKNFVTEWMLYQDKDIEFEPDENGYVMFRRGACSINIASYFQMILEDFLESQALESYKDGGWVSVEERLPEMIEGKDYSENVIAWLDGERKIMCYSLLPDDDNNLCHAWCMVYDGLDGDGEFDDNYYPTHWQPLPSPPQTKTI